MCSGMVTSSFSTKVTRHVTFLTNPGIGHKWGHNRILITTNGTYSWSFVTQIFRNSYDVDCETRIRLGPS